MQSTEVASAARTHTVQSVLHALMSVGRLIRQRGQGETLDPGAFWLLKTVAMNGSMRVTDLASSANLDTSTVSRHVAQLHKVGWIERTPDPDDRRAQRVRVSAAGQSTLDRALAARTAVLARSLEEWSQADLEELDRLVTRLVADVENLSQKLEQS
jgi:DNA-binding MarR family transcriptional regulator